MSLIAVWIIPIFQQLTKFLIFSDHYETEKAFL